VGFPVTQRSRFFDSVSGDRVYGSDALAQVIFALMGDGVVGAFGNELAVSEASPAAMSVRVNTGAAFVQGRYLEVYGSQEVLAIAAAHATLPRIDRVVVRVDLAARTMALAVKTGTAASSPVAPALTQAAGGTWEISLALVAVGANVVSIVNANITDDRGDRARGSDVASILKNATGHRHEGSDATGRKVRHADLDSRNHAGAHNHADLGAVGTDDHHPKVHDHDAAGEGNVPWSNVSGKPTEFNPEEHSADHGIGDLPYWGKGGTLGGRIHVGTSTPDPGVVQESDVWIKG
jgi:hypothetical protein